MQSKKKDKHTRRRVQKRVDNRRRLLRYLKGEDVKRYEKLTDKLKLKRDSN